MKPSLIISLPIGVSSPIDDVRPKEIEGWEVKKVSNQTELYSPGDASSGISIAVNKTKNSRTSGSSLEKGSGQRMPGTASGWHPG
jgi:hypothetical protein